MTQREIKFRIWDIEEKRMAVVPELSFGSDGSGKTTLAQWQNDKGFTKYRVVGESCELMQFTGLKDKNGKEIYEGDIIKADKEEWALLEVRWHNERGFYILDVKNSLGWWNFPLDGMQVIGNIYENPELIK